MAHFFICYARKDVDFARLLKSNIQDAGFTVWMDLERVEAGQYWSEKINEAIKNAFALIVVVTPESKGSEYVTYEWTLALETGIRVIPVMLKFTELHPRLRMLNYLDFTNRVARRWDILMDVLKDASQPYTAQLKGSIKAIADAGAFMEDNKYFTSNICFRHIVIHSLNETKNQIDSAIENSKFFIPANQYPWYLISLQRELYARVKAVALVDQQEQFWLQKTGREIMQTIRQESSRVFVFTTPEQFDENVEILLKYATHYHVYAMSYEVLTRSFGLYAKDFSIIEVDGDKVVAEYEDNGSFKTLCFTADEVDIALHEEALENIIRRAIPIITRDADEVDKIRDRVFYSSKLSILLLRYIEMSGYIPIDDYDEHEERHAYYQEMMQKMIDFFVPHRGPELQHCRVLELGAGTGIFTKRLAKLPAIECIAVEIDIVCFNRLRRNLTSHYPTVYPIYEDSRTYTSSDRFKYIFSSFADHHIKLEDKSLYLENIKRNLAIGGRLILGDEFLPSHDPNDYEMWKTALTTYHNHIISIAEENAKEEIAKLSHEEQASVRPYIEARAQSYRELAKLERAALQSGLAKQGDFKISCEQYEEMLKFHGFQFSKEKIGPKDMDNVGGVYVYIAWISE